MAIGQVVAGAYTSAYNAAALNYTKDGFRVSLRTHAERIDQSDVYGQSLLDIIYRGTDISIETIARIYNVNTMNAFFPWMGAGNNLGAISTTLNPVAQRGIDMAKALVMTSTTNTSAASSPATATAALAILSPENNPNLLFSSQAREVPIKWDLLPSIDGSSNVTRLILT